MNNSADERSTRTLETRGAPMSAAEQNLRGSRRGREMRGWLRVDAGDVATKRELSQWVKRGAAYARSLPAKR